MKINLAMHCPNMKDVTSLYRGIGPTAELRKLMDVDVSVFNEMSWVTCKTADVIYIQRPYTDSHLAMAKMAKKNHKPLWIDYDDFLLDVPVDNPAFDFYMNEKTHANITKLLGIADVVTVTTKALKALYEQTITLPDGTKIELGKNVIVVPNSYDYYFHGDPVKNSGNKLITWRGSNTHDRDLDMYGEPIVHFMNENPDWKIEFIGFRPWRIVEAIKPEQVMAQKELDPFYYMDYLRKRNPSIHIVPLNDSIFNRSKSNIAWIEATIAGAVCVVPEWEEWKRPGVVAFQNPIEFYNGLKWCSENLDKLEGLRKMSLDSILDGFELSRTNAVRVALIKALAAGSDLPEGCAKLPREEVLALFNQDEEGVMELE